MPSESELRDQLTAKFADVKLENLMDFMDFALNREHDYGTICVAIGACAVAAAKAADRSEHGGITGFQAGAIFWEFVRGWNTFDEGPKRMVQYANMLYPQYAEKFAQTIDPATWKWLQEKAASNLVENPNAHENVIAHWTSIANGVIPFGYSVSDV